LLLSGIVSDWSRYAGLRTLGAAVLKLSEIGHVVPLSETHLQRFIAFWVSDAAFAELEVA
jgi:hypothetical protein